MTFYEDVTGIRKNEIRSSLDYVSEVPEGLGGVAESLGRADG